jgi:hypothetical protein
MRLISWIHPCGNETDMIKEIYSGSDGTPPKFNILKVLNFIIRCYDMLVKKREK